MSQLDFSQLALHADLQENLASMGYSEMTEIQAQALPPILSGEDVIAQAKTGSGKTAAFGLGILQRLNVKYYRVQTLVLCPTRELADQVAKEIRKLARQIHNIKVLTLCGGMPFGPQIGSLEHGAHIVVGTPGRIEEHLRKGTLKLNDVNMFVLDEADRMLDMGFQPTLDAIMEFLPTKRQTLLFSATYPDEIKTIAADVMQSPVMVQVATIHDDNSIAQYFHQVSDNLSRLDAVALLLQHHRPDSAVIFCNTKRETQEVANNLRTAGFGALALHGDLEQKQRDQTLVRFANKSASVLVATDVAARGLDIEALDLVINYQIARELDVHIHRIGRTGRAGSQGVACTVLTEKEQFKFNALAEHLQQTLTLSPLPVSKQVTAYKPAMMTLQIDGGKKQKVRAGDILGALTGDRGIDGKDVGKIHLFDNWAYVAVRRDVATTALRKLEHGKLKGRSFRVRPIRG